MCFFEFEFFKNFSMKNEDTTDTEAKGVVGTIPYHRQLP
jgi:hypothetical protein